MAKPSHDAVRWIHGFAFLIFEIMVMACLSTFQGHTIIICLWHLFHGMYISCLRFIPHVTYGLTCFTYYKYLLSMSLAHISQFGSDLCDILIYLS